MTKPQLTLSVDSLFTFRLVLSKYFSIQKQFILDEFHPFNLYFTFILLVASGSDHLRLEAASFLLVAAYSSFYYSYCFQSHAVSFDSRIPLLMTSPPDFKMKKKEKLTSSLKKSLHNITFSI